jgi:hypothetical protein
VALNSMRGGLTYKKVLQSGQENLIKQSNMINANPVVPFQR